LTFQFLFIKLLLLMWN